MLFIRPAAFFLLSWLIEYVKCIQCHKAKNLVPETGGQATRTGEAVLEIQVSFHYCTSNTLEWIYFIMCDRHNCSFVFVDEAPTGSCCILLGNRCI